MKFINFSKIALILIVPILIFLIVFSFSRFSDSFFRSEFLKYGVNDRFLDAEAIHNKVIDFMQGKSNDLPSAFSQREKDHLADVRQVISSLTITLYIMIILFVALLIWSSFMLRVNTSIINFIGKILMWGGILTVGSAILLFAALKFDFSFAFESMHRLFFEKGAYLFDPAKEAIVNLYPEQLFMDLGIRISAWSLIIAFIAILIGIYLVFRTK